jgi:hypothetical protein
MFSLNKTSYTNSDSPIGFSVTTSKIPFVTVNVALQISFCNTRLASKNINFPSTLAAETAAAVALAAEAVAEAAEEVAAPIDAVAAAEAVAVAAIRAVVSAGAPSSPSFPFLPSFPLGP